MSTTATEGAGLTIRCRLCHKDFTFEAEDQQRYAARGWSAPVHCWPCRQWRRAPRATRGPAPGGTSRACSSCGMPFTWTRAKAHRAASQGFAAPRTCPSCRARRALIAAAHACRERLILTGATDLDDAIGDALASRSPDRVRAAHALLTQWQQEQVR